MTSPDESAYRLSHRAAGGVTVRDPDDVESDEAMFEVRLPIASTGEVRNEGDEPLTREEVDGMARQLREREIGVFPSHGGDTMVTGGRYSQLEKLGVWTDASVEERDGEDLLMATARMPDPEELPAATGEYRQALAILKEQATRGIPMDASIGWRDDEDSPGGVDLMEASIVGIGADPRTNTGDEGASVVARAALKAGANADDLVAEVRAAVDSERPLGPPEDPDRFDTFEECVQSLMDEDTSREEAEAICGAWEQAKDEQSADDTHDSMTDDDPGDDPGTTDEEQDAEDADNQRVSEDEYREQMLDLQTQQMEVLNTLADDEDDEQQADDDEDGEEDDDEDEDEDEQDADEPDDTQSADPDDDAGDDDTVAELREELETQREELDDLRSKTLTGDDVDTPDSESERDAAPDDDDADGETEQRDTTDDDTADSLTDGLGNYR